MRRRDFIKKSALGSTSLMVPAFLKSYNLNHAVGNNLGKKLIVIQLSGGNDGLNTVVPYRDDLYYNYRPKLALKTNEVIRLNDTQGLNPAMKALQGIYDEGYLSIINSVGYPNPNRSHFRSMDIWQTASGSQEYLSTGWLGRYLDNDCLHDPVYHAIEIDDSLSFAMKGKQRSGFAMSDPKKMRKVNENKFLNHLGNHHHNHEEENVDYLYKTMIETQSSANYLLDQSKTYKSGVSYPKTGFGKDLKTIAELITAETATKVYYVSLGGFDTHVGQISKQARLLEQYAEGVKALVKDLKQNRLLEDTLILTFSEFGRRVQQNGSNGTDHGTANNVFMISGDLKQKGFYNEAPNLSDLENGDIKYKIDFRNIYANVIDQWLDADSNGILGRQFKSLGIV